MIRTVNGACALRMLYSKDGRMERRMCGQYMCHCTKFPAVYSNHINNTLQSAGLLAIVFAACSAASPQRKLSQVIARHNW